MSFPFIQQLDRMDCGPVCLQIVSKFYGKNYGISYLREACDIGKDGVSLLGMKNGARTLGLEGYGVNCSINDIIDQKILPIILYWNQEHFVVLYKIKEQNGQYKFYISDPAKGKYILDASAFLRCWTGGNNAGDMTKGIGLFLDTTEKFLDKEISQLNALNYSGFKTIIKEALAYRKHYYYILAGIFLSLIIQVLIPFISKSIFDYGIANEDFNLVILFTVSQLLFTVFNILITFFRNWSMLYIGSRINIGIMSQHLSKLLRLNFSYFDRKNSGDIIQRINDNSRIEDFLTTSFVTIIMSVTSLAVFEIVLLIFNNKLFVFFNIVLILYFIWVRLLLNKIKNIDFQRFDSASKNQSFVIQLINGIQDIKLGNAISKKIYEWSNLREDLFDYNQKFIILKQIQSLGSFLLINVSTMVIVAFASYAVINHTMTIGELIAIQFILAQLVSPIENIVQFLKAYNDAKLSVERLNEIDDYPLEDSIPDIADNFEKNHDILFHNVSFSYPGTNGKLSLKNINLNLCRGKVNAIVGASGSGKTTFIKLLLKMYPPDIGEISIGNNKLNDIGFDLWRAFSGSVMQDGYIFSDSILNNIIIDGGEINRDKLKEAISIANIQSYLDQLPNGIYTKIGLDGSGLSQGQKQRLLIARCVYKNPELIIFDEATNALDSVNENIIYKNLEKFYEKRTVVTIAHRLSTIKNAAQIIVFDDGEVVEIGSHNELLEKKGVYYKLIYNQQFDNVFH